VQFSPDGAHLATSSWDGSVRLWDPNTGTETVFSLKGHLGGVNNITFSPDSRTLITSGDDNSVRFWSVATGTEMISISGIDGYDGEILSADANTIAWKLLNQGASSISAAFRLCWKLTPQGVGEVCCGTIFTAESQRV